ncbi:MAG: hypothetical protein IPO95_04195 [Rhodanobacteraceae bacterium]|nr:hypothetical protein [Rhodanobacteraceae bacterium]MBL0039993.1 hypothetical protein [Xanthomonadales bacterium]
MIRLSRLLPLFALCIGLPAHAADQNRRVGVGTGCTDATLTSAFNAIRTQTGTHTIRINKGNYALPDGLTYLPTVNQTAVFIEGGYDNCMAVTPTGSTASDADLAVVSGAGGTSFPVLDLVLNGRVQTFQMRRIVVTGGEDSGLYVTGQASVLLGVGAKIRGNSSATNGGGIVLNGSPTNNTSTFARIDLYIDEGAEVINNIAMDRGGGIYCGSPSGVDTHASIVFRDGILGYNQADEGAAFYCRGSLEGGGGFQPRPRSNRAALIIGNQSTSNGSGVRCAAGFGTLDTVLPVQPDGFRHVGADADSNGLLAIAANGGTASPALCLIGSRTWGDIGNPAPAGQSRFLLRNLHVSSQFGNGFVGLSTRDAMELIVAPSGDTVNCTFFTATPCVRFTDNSVDAGAGNLLHASGGSMLQLRRAMIDGNTSRSELGLADDTADVILMASILDDNTVMPRSTSPSTSSLFTAQFGGAVDVRNSTIIMRSTLNQFFRLGSTPLVDNTGIGYAQSSAFSSTVGAPSAVEFEGGTPTTNFRRYWCGYFANTSTNFSGHTVVNNVATGTYNLAASFSVDANYSPTHADLRDACTAPPGAQNRDFYGRPYSVDFPPTNSLQADIGAVEAQLQVDIFENGFES